MKTNKTAWVINPRMDIGVLIATPLLLIPGIHLLLKFIPLSWLTLGVLSVSAAGHHFPGFIRAYTDKIVFQQFKSRLIFVPALFILFALAATYFKLTVIFCALMVWGTWHGCMQIHGFLRIYDAKANFHSAFTARLDYWMCITWFVQVILWSTAKKMSVISIFYLAGGPLISPKGARIFESVWLTLTLAVTVAFLSQLATNAIKHHYFNLPKLLCMVSSFGFWAICMIHFESLILGLILWEIYHDLQYNAFVWDYNKNRVAKGYSQSKIEQFLFHSNWKKVAFYTVCITLYGCIGLLYQDTIHLYQGDRAYGTFLSQIGNVFAASGLIHFYMDGFIWKLRDGKVRRDLGMQAAEGYKPRAATGHWIFIALFFAVSAYLGAAEHFRWNASPNQIPNLLALVPKSGYANFMMASQFKTENRPDSALVYYERAIEYDSSYNFSHLFIADLKARNKDFMGAILNYQKALQVDPEDIVVRENLAFLYNQTQQYTKAEYEYRLLLDRDPSNPDIPFQLAWSLLQRKKGLEAKPYLEQTLKLNPNHAQAWNYLGMIEQATGNMREARLNYQRALDLDSGYVHAKTNLSSLLEPMSSSN